MATLNYAIIVAGGQGTRMQRSIPKQFIPIEGKPVLMHTIEAFTRCSFPINIIVVLPKAEIAVWDELCQSHSFDVPHQVAIGGASRSASVQSGLQQIDSKDGVVAIHDGVRPLVSKELIERSLLSAEQYGSAVASVPLKDSIRRTSGSKSEAVSREQYRLIQTPQTFRLALLRKAYQLLEGQSFSDDASLVERSGHRVHLIEGDYQNLKITTPEDLTVATALLKQTLASGT